MARNLLLCGSCWIQFKSEELAWYEPMLGTELPEFYLEPTKGYVCPLCDKLLDKETLKECGL